MGQQVGNTDARYLGTRQLDSKILLIWTRTFGQRMATGGRAFANLLFEGDERLPDEESAECNDGNGDDACPSVSHAEMLA